MLCFRGNFFHHFFRSDRKYHSSKILLEKQLWSASHWSDGLDILFEGVLLAICSQEEESDPEGEIKLVWGRWYRAHQNDHRAVWYESSLKYLYWNSQFHQHHFCLGRAKSSPHVWGCWESISCYHLPEQIKYNWGKVFQKTVAVFWKIRHFGVSIDLSWYWHWSRS